MSIRVLLADDHAMLRQGLRRLLEACSDVEVVGEARDGREAIRRAEELEPDVVLMDVVMPRLNGVEATAKLLAGDHQLRILALSGSLESGRVGPMIRAGASGYVLKDAGISQLARAVKEVAAGRSYFSPLVEAFLLEGGALALSPSGLTLREREVLQLLAEGFPTSAIARELGIGVKTVETHRKRVMDKLDLRSVAELTKYAVREGLTSLDE